MTDTVKKMGFVFRSGPYGTANPREMLDLLLVASAYDQAISLFFIGEGLLHLRSGQAPAELGIKNHTKILAGLDLYDIEHLYVRQSDLKRFNLEPSALITEVILLSDPAFAAQLGAQEQVVTA